MDWRFPYLLLLIPFVLAVLMLADAKSNHPMSSGRKRMLLMVRSLLVILVITALASPAWVVRSQQQAVVFVLDHSQSLGEKGVERAYEAMKEVRSRIGESVEVGVVSAGKDGSVIAYPGQPIGGLEVDPELISEDGAATDLANAITLSKAVFPAGTSRHIVLLTDGQETVGSLEESARSAAVTGFRIHSVPISGEQRPDVRVTSLVSSQSRVTEGASIDLTATVQASIAGSGVLKLYENGLEVDREEITLEAGQTERLVFSRSPDKRNTYRYRVVIDEFADDAIPENNESLAIVDVRGKPLLLYVEGEQGESKYLMQAMAKEGIRLDARKPNQIPSDPLTLEGYDAIIFSDVPAHEIGEARMMAVRDYVEKLGGGFVMIGGTNSFGVGGYYRTPIEELLPVKLRGPDHEEDQSSALALVIDRSGSMSGQKIEICKSAAAATAELLNDKDYIGVYAFDSSVHTVVPMTRVGSTSSISSQIAMLSSGGGTNIYPGMSMAKTELGKVKAKIKHMIVLTDGQTSGQGYQQLAAQCNSEGITISTVAVGSGAQIGLLQAIAAAGGGKSYVTMDPTAITRIFTQDTMVHTGRLIREEPFQAELVEDHPMLRNWEDAQAPPLLGYVKTNRKSTSQVPLVTAEGDPLLSHWNYGLGKVTAFTSDCKSRWAALWVSSWDGYSKIWAQVLRETARSPQGRNMDLSLESKGVETEMVVALMKDAGTPRNDADVDADIFFSPPNALGSSMELIANKQLQQEGSGIYKSTFRPTEAGVYLVRARAGAQLVSAGYVHNPSGEVATGEVDTDLLKRVTEITGGQYLENPEQKLELTGFNVARYVELWPYLMMIFLALLILDVSIRRWENLQGMFEVIRGR